MTLFTKQRSDHSVDVQLAKPGQKTPPGYQKVGIEVALDDTTVYGKKWLFSNQSKRIGQDYEVELEYKSKQSDHPAHEEILAAIDFVSQLIDQEALKQLLPWGGNSKQKRGYDAIGQAYWWYRGWKPSKFVSLGQPISVVRFGQSQSLSTTQLSLSA